ncbi:MAG: hypothetical protein ABWZ14_10985 [Acidimicrobiales bacterium]
MSTVVLTLVVVGGSIAVAARLAGNGERKPATEPPVRHRARRRKAKAARRAAAAPSAALADRVSPRPGLLVRVRAGVTLVAMMAMIGAGIALGLLLGVQVISRTLEAAVQ